MRLKDRIALVTGGSGGIGSAICLGLAAEGAHVAVQYCHGETAAREVVLGVENRGRRALPLKANLTEPANVADLVKAVVGQFGRQVCRQRIF